MEKRSTVSVRKYLLFGLMLLALASFITCNNPIMEKWWPEPSPANPKSAGSDTDVVGGSGDNFGVVIFDADGGTPQPQPVKIAWGNTIGRLRPVARGNDGFLGWFDEYGNPWDLETRPVKEINDSGDPNDKNGDGFITLTAQWEPYDPVTFNTINFETYPSSSVPVQPDQPSIISPQYIPSGGYIVPPPIPRAPENLGFAGWYTEDTFINQWVFNDPNDSHIGQVNADMTLYAKWENTICTVHFEANGGTRPDGVTQLTHTQTISKDYGVIQDPGPLVKDGYSFGGWYGKSDFSDTPWNFVNDKIPADAGDDFYLYARWEQNTYIVKFQTIPSLETVDDQNIIHGGKVTKPANPQQLGDGRGFDGWYSVDGESQAGGWNDQYLWDFNTPVTRSMTLYARWMAQTRTVRFQPNGGLAMSGMEMNPTSFSIPITPGMIMNPGSPVRTGYTFGGWYTDPACTISWNFMADRVTTPDTIIGMDPMYFYAKWTPIMYTVSFVDSDGGSPVPAAQRIAYGERAEEPPLMSLSGMAFDGWYKDNGDKWNFDTGVTSSVTLYARWETAVYTVRFHSGYSGNPQGGPLNAVYTNAWPVDQRVSDGGTVTEPFMPPLPAEDATFSSIYWSFLRWDYAPGYTGNPDSVDRSTLQPWDFNTPLTDTNTVNDAGVNVLNLYARWVPPEPDMIWVPKGSFIMGDSGVSGSPAAYHAYPTRVVTVDGFYIGRYEIPQYTRGDSNPPYQDPGLMPANPSQFSRNDARPVERVSWYDAVTYCNLLTAKMSATTMGGLTQVYTISGETYAPNALSGTSAKPITNATVTWKSGNPNGYRLPTEAEWEYAAKGGNGMGPYLAYAGSNNPDDVAWYNLTVQSLASGVQCTQTVGQKSPNTLGIYDMSGNVSEWCWDWFAPYKDIINQGLDPSLYDNPRGPTNPVSNISGLTNHDPQHVRRGGAWSNAAGNVRSVVRNSDTPNTATWVNGFRVVRGPSEIW